MADLVAALGHLRCDRQNLAFVKGRAAPEHIGQDRSESVLRQPPDGFVPVQTLDAKRTVTPKSPKLAWQRLLRQTESLREPLAGCRGLLPCLGIFRLREQLDCRFAQTGPRSQSLRHPRVLGIEPGDPVGRLLVVLEAGKLANARNGGFGQVLRGGRRRHCGLAKVAQEKLGVRLLPAPGGDADRLDLTPAGGFALGVHLRLVNLDRAPICGRFREEARVIPALDALEIDREI